MFDNYVTKNQLIKLHELLNKAIAEAGEYTAAWRETTKEAWSLATDMNVFPIDDILWGTYKLKGSGAPLYGNAVAFLRIARHEVVELIKK